MIDFKELCDDLRSKYNIRHGERTAGIMKNAADAIEELQALVNYITDERDRECELRHKNEDRMQAENERLKAQLDEYHKFDGFLMMHGCFEVKEETNE